MSEPCKRCGDPDESHEGIERETAVERNCNLYRIGTELARLNDQMERLIAVVKEAAPMDLLKLVYPDGVIPTPPESEVMRRYRESCDHIFYPGEQGCRLCGQSYDTFSKGGK